MSEGRTEGAPSVAGRVTFVQADGTSIEVAFSPGATLMRAATDNGIDGIDADCGGSCVCGTCHVYIASEWLAALNPPDGLEEATLEFAVGQQPNSRLACQIELGPDLDGIVVYMPKSQF